MRKSTKTLSALIIAAAALFPTAIAGPANAATTQAASTLTCFYPTGTVATGLLGNTIMSNLDCYPQGDPKQIVQIRYSIGSPFTKTDNTYTTNNPVTVIYADGTYGFQASHSTFVRETPTSERWTQTTTLEPGPNAPARTITSRVYHLPDVLDIDTFLFFADGAAVVTQ